MNMREKKMLHILKDLKANYGVVAVKAEFEAEGTRMDELLRLIEIVRKADLGVGLKIGGCEAVRDLMESRQIGVDYIIAPMVETAYALSKFVEAKNKVYSLEEQEDTSFLFNIETITSFNNLESLVKVATQEHGVDGVVFGRVDFSGSLNLDRDTINTQTITDFCIQTAAACRDVNLDFVVGGGVSMDALPMLHQINNTYLSRFETRKVIFSSRSLSLPDMEKALLQAVHFELLWLLNKRDYYSVIAAEDDKRIAMLDNRWKILNN